MRSVATRKNFVGKFNWRLPAWTRPGVAREKRSSRGFILLAESSTRDKGKIRGISLRGGGREGAARIARVGMSGGSGTPGVDDEIADGGLRIPQGRRWERMEYEEEENRGWKRRLVGCGEWRLWLALA